VDKHGPKNKIGEQFTEIFIKHPDSVGLILTFLEEFDFRVRWPALKLLMHLLTNRSKDIQEIILVSPMGVSKLMDLLSDSREVIRNDVCLLLSSKYIFQNLPYPSYYLHLFFRFYCYLSN